MSDYTLAQHEKRLDKVEGNFDHLEEGVSDMKADIAVLKSQLAEGFEMLAAKMDQVNALTTRVAVIETKQHSASKGLKFLSTLFVVAFGALLAFLGLK